MWLGVDYYPVQWKPEMEERVKAFVEKGGSVVFTYRLAVKDKDNNIPFKYGDSFYQNFAAITMKKTGKGCAYYIGCGLEESITSLLMEQIMLENDIKAVDSEKGIEIAVRGDESQKVLIYINHNAFEAVHDNITLAPFECKIVEI